MLINLYCYIISSINDIPVFGLKQTEIINIKGYNIIIYSYTNLTILLSIHVLIL